MAAHDDKISNNRRRLFKALSAAPVVMTLRPGSAIASTSAYQCIAKNREISLVNWYEDSTGPDANSCALHPELGLQVCEVNHFKYAVRRYWLVSQGAGLPNPNHPDACIPDYYAIVETGTGFYGIDVPTSTANPVSLPDVYEDPENENRILINSTEPPNKPCWGNNSPHNGLFVVIGYGVDDMTFVITGVYPEALLASNSNQGISGTCLCSVDPDNPICISNG